MFFQLEIVAFLQDLINSPSRLFSFSHELKQNLPKTGTKPCSEHSSEEEDDDDEEEEEEQEEEEEIEEEEVDEEEDESNEAQGGSSSHHKNVNNKNTQNKRPVPALKTTTTPTAPQKPVRFAVDADNKPKAGVAAFLPHHHPDEYVPPPPAVAAPAPPPTITESRPGGEGGGSTIGGAHRPLQRSATLPANPQRNITLQLANKHRIVHFCNAVSVPCLNNIHYTWLYNPPVLLFAFLCLAECSAAVLYFYLLLNLCIPSPTDDN